MLSTEYTRFAQNLHLLDADVLASSLGLEPLEAPMLAATLREVARWSFDLAAEGKPVLREELFRKFVVADGTEPADGNCDRSKPMSAQLKQLFDLKYNVNLADCVGAFALTPLPARVAGSGTGKCLGDSVWRARNQRPQHAASWPRNSALRWCRSSTSGRSGWTSGPPAIFRRSTGRR
jgi:hypothetical protein